MIETTAAFPIYITENLVSLKEFYVGIFGFDAVFFDPSFYLHLLHPDNGIQLAFMVPGHPSQPGFLHPQTTTDGLVISFEVSSAQHALDEANRLGLKLIMDLTEESWGQRHFMLRDPAGFVIDIVEHTGE